VNQDNGDSSLLYDICRVTEHANCPASVCRHRECNPFVLQSSYLIIDVFIRRRRRTANQAPVRSSVPVDDKVNTNDPSQPQQLQQQQQQEPVRCASFCNETADESEESAADPEFWME